MIDDFEKQFTRFWTEVLQRTPVNELNDLAETELKKVQKQAMRIAWNYQQNRIDALEAEIKQYETGFKGACSTCEPVGELNLKLEAENKELRRGLEFYGDHNNYGWESEDEFDEGYDYIRNDNNLCKCGIISSGKLARKILAKYPKEE